MALTDLQCRTAKPAEKRNKLSDSGGLQLWVEPTGSKLWRYAYRIQHRQRVYAIGAYPFISLAQAREERDAAKRLVRQNIDPTAERRRARAAGTTASETFKGVSDDYLEKLKRSGLKATTLKKNVWLLGLAMPVLGAMSMRQIKASDILIALRRVEVRGTLETAHRLRSTIGGVFRYAIAVGQVDGDPSVGLGNAVARPKRRNRAAITGKAQFGALLRSIDGYAGQPTVKAALQLMALWFMRPGELAGAKWCEIDPDLTVLRVPEERAKGGRNYDVPIAPQARALLKLLRELSGHTEFLFPGMRSESRPLSNNTLNAALRNLGYSGDEATAHGFRASASTLLNQYSDFKPDAIERQLAHVERSKTRGSYARGDHWEERIIMMSWWADFLDELKKERPARLRAVA